MGCYMGSAGRKFLCKLTDIDDGGSKGFDIGVGSTQIELFVARKGNCVYAYENSCPHTGGPLDWTPDQFIHKESGHILCATHGAIFRLQTGQCLAGPCTGEWLRALPVSLDGIDIILEPFVHE